MSKFKKALDAIKDRQTEEQPKRGKRSDPNYQQITAYLPKDLHHALKVALAQDKQEMSALFEELIKDWLKARKQPKGVKA